MKAASWKVLVAAAILAVPLTGCVERATLDVLHVDDITLTFREPRHLDIDFNVYQFKGGRSAVITLLEVGAIMRLGPDNATEDPMHASQATEEPEPLQKGEWRHVTHTFTLPEPADDPEYYSMYSAGILVRYRLEGAGTGGEVVYSSPCFTRANEPVNTTNVLCREVYRFDAEDDDPPLPGAPEWQARLDACCPGRNATG